MIPMIRQLDDILNQRDYQAVNYVMQSLQRKSLRLEHATPQVDFCSPLSTSACVLVSLSLSQFGNSNNTLSRNRLTGN